MVLNCPQAVIGMVNIIKTGQTTENDRYVSVKRIKLLILLLMGSPAPWPLGIENTQTWFLDQGRSQVVSEAWVIMGNKVFNRKYGLGN